MQNEEVKNFYNSFLKSRMLDYRLNNGNERINLASKFILKNISSDDNILEIGCGIGMVTERIAKKVKSGFIWACDISDQNIWYAKRTIRASNIDFFTVDILDQFNIIKDRIKKPIDVFIFVDVIEHLPLDRHFELFRNILSIASNNFEVMLTFPSHYYQNYLIENNPDELQIIDEIITIEHIGKITELINSDIVHFEMKNVSMDKQYIHCLLSNKKIISHYYPYKSSSLPKKILIRLYFTIKELIQVIIRYFRKRKYVKNVFKEY